MSPQAVSGSAKADLRRAYEVAQGPFMVGDEQGGFIVMRPSNLDNEQPLHREEIESLRAGYLEYLQGKCMNYGTAIAWIEKKYGL